MVSRTHEDELELWRRRDSDPAAREELVTRHLPFAKSLALRYRGASEPLDDLIQVANLGLLNAIDRYNPERGIPFVGFAAPTILGELKRHFRDRAWTVRVPRALHDRLAAVEKAIESLTSSSQRSPTVAEIATDAGLEEIEVLEVMEAGRKRRPISMDRTVAPDGEEEISPAEWIGEVDEQYELVEDRSTLGVVLPTLSERERKVLELRFVEEMTQSQIATQIGCSQMHVSRILRRTLSEIRRRTEGVED
ncbi:MAG TPA: SigB/SigF/SigG family RNA polymerase sigma factor [Solirubrobacterales bacterium]|nr:SigB/SigF/SigG family RNA polymerase sigma factor [Solirubrobacterales bacterium]